MTLVIKAVMLSVLQRFKSLNFLAAVFKCLLLTTFLSTMASGAYARQQAVELVEPAKALPDFELQNQRGEAFSRDDLLNQWSLIFLGFTTCPDVCPVTLMKLEGVRAELGLRFTPDKIPQVVFLAVDPARDRAVLADYLAHFHPSHIGITGEVGQIDQLVKGLDAFYRIQKPKPGSDYYDVQHTAAIALINPKGEMVAKFKPPFHVQPIAQTIHQIIRSGMQGLGQ